VAAWLPRTVAVEHENGASPTCHPERSEGSGATQANNPRAALDHSSGIVAMANPKQPLESRRATAPIHIEVQLTMLTDEVRAFVSENKQAVLTTFRKNGAAQMSIVTVCPYGDGVGFSTTTDRAKLVNARRDPRCSLLVSKPDWWGFVVLEGQAQVLAPDNTDADELRLTLRGVYRGAAGKEHPDWDDYDAAMVRDSRAVMIVVPDRVYGTAL
tara:strand:- start:2420 stop:3058 length:639 start_codon:yes stop_codon:yes gene_type:complete